MTTMLTHRRYNGMLVLLASTLSCGPASIEQDCVPLDEKLGTISHQWCDGEPFPIDIEWEEEIPVATYPVCLAPEPDGTCNRCPTTEIEDAVEPRLLELLASYRPECQVRHWELGCMRTIENGMKLEREEGYCCFQVAIWGNDECR